jgi:nitrile hydratase
MSQFICAEPNGQLAGVLLKVVEDTPTVYNLLVCTLCSCYPISVLGMHPWKPQ